MANYPFILDWIEKKLKLPDWNFNSKAELLIVTCQTMLNLWKHPDLVLLVASFWEKLQNSCQCLRRRSEINDMLYSLGVRVSEEPIQVDEDDVQRPLRSFLEQIQTIIDETKFDSTSEKMAHFSHAMLKSKYASLDSRLLKSICLFWPSPGKLLFSDFADNMLLFLLLGFDNGANINYISLTSASLFLTQGSYFRPIDLSQISCHFPVILMFMIINGHEDVQTALLRCRAYTDTHVLLLTQEQQIEALALISEYLFETVYESPEVVLDFVEKFFAARSKTTIFDRLEDFVGGFLAYVSDHIWDGETSDHNMWTEKCLLMCYQMTKFFAISNLGCNRLLACLMARKFSSSQIAGPLYNFWDLFKPYTNDAILHAMKNVLPPSVQAYLGIPPSNDPVEIDTTSKSRNFSKADFWIEAVELCSRCNPRTQTCFHLFLMMCLFYLNMIIENLRSFGADPVVYSFVAQEIYRKTQFLMDPHELECFPHYIRLFLSGLAGSNFVLNDGDFTEVKTPSNEPISFFFESMIVALSGFSELSSILRAGLFVEKLCCGVDSPILVPEDNDV